MSCSARVRLVGFALTASALLGSLVAFAASTTPAATPAVTTPAAGAAPAMIKGPSKGTAAAAKAIFTSKCIVCHKADGTGGVKLTGNPTPNWKDAKLWADPKHNDDFLRDCITNGKVKSGMVAWGKSGQIKPADIENLIAYIHTLKAGAAPAAAAKK
jgi:mono/diheme cytochrome c family protein